MSWVDKLLAGVSTTTQIAPILAVAAEPGWNRIGTFPIPSDTPARLDLIACVSDPSITLTVRLYNITPGSVGEVIGSRAAITSMTEARAFSSNFKLLANNTYQVQAQAVGNAGDAYFATIARATPIPVAGS